MSARTKSMKTRSACLGCGKPTFCAYCNACLGIAPAPDQCRPDRRHNGDARGLAAVRGFVAAKELSATQLTLIRGGKES